MAWQQTANKAGKYTFNTAGKYVDRDIELIIPSGSIDAVTGTAIDGTGSATITTVTIGTKADGKYPFTGSASISGSTSGTASVKGGTAGWITDSTIGSGTVTGTISGTATLNTSIVAAAANVSGAATVKPNSLTAADGNATISGSATTTTPASGYYVAATPATANNTTIIQTPSITTVGYLGNKSEISTSGNVTGGDGSKYYIPITSGSISASANDPGTDYTENTSAAISSGGYLKIDAGWIPNTKISLATLIGDDIDDITTTTASSSMLNGFKAYDISGNVLVGNIATKTSSDLTASDATVKVPAGYYASEASKTVATAGAATVSPTAVTTEVTVGTVSSGYYPLTNTIEATSSHATAGWVATTTETGSASIQVGKIAQSTSSATSGNSTSGSTLTAGATLTIGAGYYPTARTFKAPTATDSVGTTIVTAGLSLGDAPTDSNSNTYTNPTLVTSQTSGKIYITLNGTASADKDKVVSSITSPATKYMEVYTGTYSIS